MIHNWQVVQSRIFDRTPHNLVILNTKTIIGHRNSTRLFQLSSRRKGFTLLPDYASTAFMIQGATLAAGIADCGDVVDFGGLSELMTVYVILSRVKSADGLLILRAFCENLFQMGDLPGSHCLLKMLRHEKQVYQPRFQT